MKYPRILEKLYRSPWVVRDRTHAAMLSALEARLAGQIASAPELARVTVAEKSGAEYMQLGDTAVVGVYGVLGKYLDQFEMDCGGCSLDALERAARIAGKDSSVRNVLFDIHSPGGTYQGTPEMAAIIRDLGTAKNTMAFTGGDCCSGALWLASQCNQFYSTESADVGSVGVRMVLLDLTKQMEMDGVKVNAISSGKYKLSGAHFQPLTDDERAMFQAECDRIHEQFMAAVESKRDVARSDMQGQVFSGVVAAQIGMTDGVVSGLEEAVGLFPAN